jgi:hypothetical protein
MHRRTLRSFAALATVALAIGGAGSMASAASAASAAKAHTPPRTTAVNSTTLGARGVSRVVRGSAPGKGPELNNLCQQYAGLIDEALDGQERDTVANDMDGAHQWLQLAGEIAAGGKAQGCQFAFSAS